MLGIGVRADGKAVAKSLTLLGSVLSALGEFTGPLFTRRVVPTQWFCSMSQREEPIMYVSMFLLCQNVTLMRTDRYSLVNIS